ncbi:MAG: DUF1232 domain-containing protein [Bacteroidaceae bacterium]|nr:DUF1232 domain-containing protein [Bacteroidaceae bacterium]
MKKFFINRFKKGKWLNKSNSILNDKTKMTALLGKLPIYLKKEGLKKVKEDLLLLKDYISDIVHGQYKDYGKRGLMLAVAAIIYVISPLDIIPDIIPTGFLDDATIVAWAIVQLSSELEKYKRHRNGGDTIPQEDENPNMAENTEESQMADSGLS